MVPSILPFTAKQYFVAQKMDEFEGVRSARIYARDLRARLADTSLTLGNYYLRDLRLGTLDGRLPAAPAQLVVNTDLAALDAWQNFVQVIGEKYEEKNVIPIGNVVYDAMHIFRKTIDAFTTYARRSAHSIEDLQPELLEKTGRPAVYIEKMAMEAAMLSLWQGSPANLTDSVQKFELAVSDLKNDQRTTSQRCRVSAIASLLDSWDTIKPNIQMFGIKFTYDEKQVAEMMNNTAALASKAGYMQTMFEEQNPTCSLVDSGGVRAFSRIVAVLSGLLASLRMLH
jgi:hypothetical protein